VNPVLHHNTVYRPLTPIQFCGYRNPKPMANSRLLGSLLVCVVIVRAQAQFTQQGSKLVGSGSVGSAWQGTSVALSSDGNTAIIGGPRDNEQSGAAWVFTRSGGLWSQQASKLIGSGATGSAWQGTSVALSSDGNTAIIGGWADNNYLGAAWVFTRSGGVWSQQGNKLVGTGAVGTAQQGVSVALSSDGNTAIIGGIGDNGSAGAAWVFTRSGGVWSQDGNKLVGSGAILNAFQGGSVSLSADGNTAIVGGEADNNYAGAAWVFTRSGGVWSQLGSKLVGTGAAGSAEQGSSVALSADGSTAIVGGFVDNDGAGAAWVFNRSGGVWSQEGNKLVGSGAIGSANRGISVALSSDGNTGILGGTGDNGFVGAAWVFTRLGNSWSQQGSKLVGSGGIGKTNQGSVALSSDGNTAIIGGVGDSNLAGAAWVFTRACQVSVPSLSQTSSEWGGLAYANIVGPTITTIAGRGSALTSLTMTLNYLGQTWNPGTLNSRLDLDGGYTPAPGASVIWPTATAASTGSNPASPVVFDDLGGWINSNLDLNGAFAAVEAGICAATPLPVIVAVRSPRTNNFPGHFVLVTGEIVNPDGSKVLTINDPAYSTGFIGTDASTGGTGYTNPTAGTLEFWTRGAVHAPPPGLTGLSISVDAVVNLMVTDPNGLQSGFSSGSPNPVQNVPHSAAGVDQIDDDETGQAGSAVETVMINAPAAGIFQISLTGLVGGRYSMEINAEASDGTVQSISFSGTTLPGYVTTFGVVYDGAHGATQLASTCDIVYWGGTNVADVQAEINEALGLATAMDDSNGDGVINVADVQIVINAALGLGCTVR